MNTGDEGETRDIAYGTSGRADFVPVKLLLRNLSLGRVEAVSSTVDTFEDRNIPFAIQLLAQSFHA